MFEIQGNGNFMPPEFWFAMTVLFGAAFVTLLLWIINRYLDQQKVRDQKVDDAIVDLKTLVHLHDHEIKQLKQPKRRNG